ncbi:hypothetical protein [Lysobacter enzymogenes]|uniref:hypothetical protein n=1 Tax=Lysobacter enzymogenes TaxID=69 RepID=UPI002027CDDD|nr:hypothetical protein [Lysobacter enzymogenes]
MHWKLPTWLRRFFIPRAPDTAATISYETKLMAARARSILWALRPPAFDPVTARYASPGSALLMRQQLAMTLGHLSVDQVAAQRFDLTAQLRERLERELRVPLTYTLGYLCQDGQWLCCTPIAGLEQMLRTGIAPDARVKLHVWLTLPSHEIIDPTFWAVLPAYACADERKNRGLFMHPDQMLGRSYHPQWTGEGFVRRIGLLKEYDSW